MKIRQISEEPNLVIPESKQNVNGVQRSFSDQLNKVQKDMVHEKLESLFTDIEKQGKVLGNTFNIKDLKKYKDLIQKFLDYAVTKMYSLKEQRGWDRRGRHKIYSMVETVNKELESLTDMLLLEQKDNISVLAKIDEIRGMLIDIYS